MNLLDRILPKAKDFQRFTPPSGALPREPMQFTWLFIKALSVSHAFYSLCFTIGSVLLAIEPYFFGRLVQVLTTSPRQAIWHDAGIVAVNYIVICQIIPRIFWQAGNATATRTFPVLTMLVRRRLSTYVYSHSYRYFQDDFSGRLAGKVIEMPQAVREMVEDIFSTALLLAAGALTSFVLFVSIDWLFGLCMLSYFALSVLVCHLGVPRIKQAAYKASLARNQMRGRYLDSISNVVLVKLFAREGHEDGLFSASMIETGGAEQNEQKQARIVARGQHGLNTLFQSTIFLMCIPLYINGRISQGGVATALALALSITGYVWTILQMSTRYIARAATIREGLDTIIQPAEVQDIASPRPLSFASSTIAFDRVTFAYPGKPIFDDFSLDIPHGQRVGLVGPSGAGKSTLVQLVLRLFDVQGGAITIGGQDVAAVAQNDLRGAIAMIPQTTDLMHRSIRDNIAYGRLDASEDQIVAAAQKAYIHDTILGLKDYHGNSGYDALVGERGVKLSGGQRQRIAIARAFLKNAPILILDEATSALDSESERLIQASLNELFQGRTVLAIAHRLSTIAHLDRIVVMEDGRIVEDGPHAALVNAGGLYARLWQLQSEGFIG